MNLILKRGAPSPSCTIGRLFEDVDFECYAIAVLNPGQQDAPA